MRIQNMAPLQNVSSFDINHKGLQRINAEKEVVIYSDPFCSIPLYMMVDKDEVLVCSDIAKMQNHLRGNWEIDEAGFWEIIIFGTPLWSRTLFKKVKQLPAASKLVVNRQGSSYRIERYWNYAIEENPDLLSKRKAAEKLHLILGGIFDKLTALNADQTLYYMGLSGGLDSRLSLAYLSERVHKDNIKLFTFGFDDRLYEYKIAKAIAESVGIDQHLFHKMIPQIYKKALYYMPTMGGGEISIAHCHILSYLTNLSQKLCKNDVLVSNYFSDALFGFAARYPKENKAGNCNNYYKKLKNAFYVKAEVSERIAEDISNVVACFDSSSNYSSINEYIYVIERNPRFHMRLSYLQSQLMKTLIPYADLDLLQFMISVPLQFRERKIILDEVLELFFPHLTKKKVGEISSRFDPCFTTTADWFVYRFFNLVNSILRKLTQGHLQLLNKYHTEEHERLLVLHFRSKLKDATDLFVERGLMNDAAKTYFNTLPLRAVRTGEQFSIISLAHLILKIEGECLHKIN